MLIGIISDIHGNEPALAATLDEMGDLDAFLFAGDLTGKATELAAVWRRLEKVPTTFIRGNHEDFALSYINLFNHDDDLAKIARRITATPERIDITIGGVAILMAHGSPWNPKSEYIYPEYNNFSRFEGLGYDVVILGHTHVPMIKQIGKVTIINPGSVGEPLASDPRPSYALLDTATKAAEIRYTQNYRENKRLRFITPFRWKSYDIRWTRTASP